MAASRLPLIVVLGATGAGKSKLAIEIAKVFNGEIISADSMQIYKGLDIISNKVTDEEQRECPHHMISYLDASSRHNTVVDFRDKALPIIDNILQRGRIPVVVGGTNYYIESLMWEFLVKPQAAAGPEPGEKKNKLKTSPGLETSTVVDETSSPQSVDNKKRKLERPEYSKENQTSGTSTSLQRKDKIDVNKDNTASNPGSETPPSLNHDVHPTTQTTQQISLDLEQRDNIIREKHNISTSPNPSSGVSKSIHDNPSCPSPSPAPPTVVAGAEDADSSGETETPSDGVSESETLLWLSSFTTQDLFDKLLQVDPDTALRHHPNNRRKLLRALQVFHESGSTLSSILAEQHRGQSGNELKSGPLRFQDPCILWVQCQQPTLNERLDGRVDTMIERGLVRELEEFDLQARTLQAGGGGGDAVIDSSNPSSAQEFPLGIMQMIGFKEFKDFLQLSAEERLSDEGQKLFDRGVTDLKTVTRRYARQQKRWINNRFCSRPGPDVPAVYAVDTTDLTKWPDTLQLALDVVSACVKGEKPVQAPEPTLDRGNFRYERHVCDVCDGRVFLHKHEWEDHIKGKKHRHNVKVLKKKRSELSSILTCREKHLESLQQGKQLESVQDVGAGDGIVVSGSDGGDDDHDSDENEDNVMCIFDRNESCSKENS